MKLLIAPIVAGLLAVPLTVPLAVPAAAEEAKIRWHQCQRDAEDTEGAELDQAGAECGELDVPLDYRRPDGRKITLSMSRLPATGDRIGTMLLNDGGPGGPGLGMPLRLRPAMREAGTRYDLIGLDPRFVGRSTPLDCKVPQAGWPWSAGSDRASFDRAARLQASMAARCTENAAEYLPHASTRETARDLDRVRSALGERKISYLGYSYGTYLGAVYAEMFPARVDRMVLDGPLDPATYGAGMLRNAGPVNEAALRAWATWAGARHSSYGLGRTADEVLRTVRSIQRVAAERGLRVGEHTLDDGVVPVLLFASLGDDRDPARAHLAGTVRTLLAATRGPVEAGEELAGLLALLLTPALSQMVSGQLAIACADRAVSRDLRTYWRDIQRHRQDEPVFGSLTRAPSPCAFWPTAPKEQPTRVDTKVPALIVAADGDPRTPYANAAQLQRALRGSSVLTVTDARKHGLFGEYGNDCVDSSVVAYLASGDLPARPVVCARS
ncbi:alpha/beta hydrolase family protein [Kribbella amoyensis]|uniref:Alpha/beta hydrolase family protein n=1 Tax=Kribbella amoyensis TaxID=996641 RepID=A0A561BNU2_9ACTN|nr:alpha/beta hydrolase [Kribbella amoyensis]TWD80527.1 alpha/beta hydrolase family protein [Kribbella amoyensis]